jgi:hypothetical protein
VVRGIGARIDPSAVAIDVPDEHRFAGQLAPVDDRVRIHRPQATLEISGRRSAMLDKQGGEGRKDSICGWVYDQRRFHDMSPASSVVGAPPRRLGRKAVLTNRYIARARRCGERQ